MEQFEQLSTKLITFIEAQQMFFVGTAGKEGRVNVSPKGLDSLRIKSPNRVHWLNLTGSGNETAAHVFENKRMTLMFCSFDKQPLILRLYGMAKMMSLGDESFENAIKDFPDFIGARQIFELDIDLVQTSCGYAVPYYDFAGERETLNKWSANKDRKGILEYHKEKNTTSIDGKPTGLP